MEHESLAQNYQPAHAPPNSDRVELHVIRVANGWLIQPTAIAAAFNDAGTPYPPNRPADIHIAPTPDDLAGYVRDWAAQQARGKMYASVSETVSGRPSYQD